MAVVMAAGISRFISTINGIREGLIDHPEFVSIMERDLKEGQHRNPTNHLGFFTTAFFHHPDELQTEMEVGWNQS